MRAAHWTAHESGALFWLCEAVHILQLIKMNNKKLYVYLMDWYWGRLKKETYQCRQKNQFTQGKRMWDVEEAFTSCSGYSIPNYSRWTLTGESTSQPIINKWVGPRSLWLLKNGGASIYWVALTPEFCLGFFFSRKKTSLKRLVHGLFSSRMRMVQLLPLFFQAPGFSEIQTCPKLLIRYTLGTNGSV